MLNLSDNFINVLDRNSRSQFIYLGDVPSSRHIVGLAVPMMTVFGHLTCKYTADFDTDEVNHAAVNPNDNKVLMLFQIKFQYSDKTSLYASR